MNSIDFNAAVAGITAVFPQAKISLVNDIPGHYRGTYRIDVRVRDSVLAHGVSSHLERFRDTRGLVHYFVEELAHSVAESALRSMAK